MHIVLNQRSYRTSKLLGTTNVGQKLGKCWANEEPNIFEGQHFWRSTFLEVNIFGGQHFWRSTFLTLKIFCHDKFVCIYCCSAFCWFIIFLRAHNLTQTLPAFLLSVVVFSASPRFNKVKILGAQHFWRSTFCSPTFLAVRYHKECEITSL